MLTFVMLIIFAPFIMIFIIAEVLYMFFPEAVYFFGKK